MEGEQRLDLLSLWVRSGDKGHHVFMVAFCLSAHKKSLDQKGKLTEATNKRSILYLMLLVVINIFFIYVQLFFDMIIHSVYIVNITNNTDQPVKGENEMININPLHELFLTLSYCQFYHVYKFIIGGRLKTNTSDTFYGSNFPDQYREELKTVIRSFPSSVELKKVAREFKASLEYIEPAAGSLSSSYAVYAPTGDVI